MLKKQVEHQKMLARQQASVAARVEQTPTPINIPMEKPVLLLPAPVTCPVMASLFELSTALQSPDYVDRDSH